MYGIDCWTKQLCFSCLLLSGWRRQQEAEIDYALGNMTNTHELGVYQQEANIALQYTVAIRDKALEAYNSIMNMSM